jgi:flagellar protein FlaG
MSIQVAATGNGFSPVELNQERVSAPIKNDTKTLEPSQEPAPKTQDVAPLDIVADLEKISVAFNKKLKFEINHQSSDVTVKVIDPETDKVIKELPPKELQRLHSRLKETIGFLFDERI